MASTFISPNYMPPDPFRRPQTGTDPVLTMQDITEAERMLRENSRPARPPEDQYSYISRTVDQAANHPMAELHKKLAQFEQYGQAEFRQVYSHHTALITRVDHLFHQIENQNAAIIELSRIIDELKQDGFQPPEPLEDVD